MNNIEKMKLKDGSEYPLGSAYFDGVSIDIDINTETDTADGEMIETITITDDSGSEPTTTTETFTMPFYRINGLDNMELTNTQLVTMWLSDYTFAVKNPETSEWISMKHPNYIVTYTRDFSSIVGTTEKFGAVMIFAPSEANEYESFESSIINIVYFSQSDIDTHFTADEQGKYIYTYTPESGVNYTIKIPSAGMYFMNYIFAEASMQGIYVQNHCTLNIGTYHIFDKTYLYPKLNNTIFLHQYNFKTLSDSKLKEYYRLYYDKRTETILQNAIKNLDDLNLCYIWRQDNKDVYQHMKASGYVDNSNSSFYAWMGAGYSADSPRGTIWYFKVGICYYPDYTTSVTSSASKTITVDNKVYEEAVSGNQGKIIFTYDGTKWSSNADYITNNHPNLVLSDIGITYPEGETPVADETITIDGRGHCLVFMTKSEQVTES